MRGEARLGRRYSEFSVLNQQVRGPFIVFFGDGKLGKNVYCSRRTPAQRRSQRGQLQFLQSVDFLKEHWTRKIDSAPIRLTRLYVQCTQRSQGCHTGAACNEHTWPRVKTRFVFNRPRYRFSILAASVSRYSCTPGPEIRMQD